MTLRFLAFLAAWACLQAAAVSMPSRPAPDTAPALAAQWRAPRLAAIDVVSLPAPLAKSAPQVSAQGPRRVASVRELSRPVAISAWTAVPGGYAAKLRVTSEEALALEVRLDLGTLPGALEVRAQGADGRIQTQLVDAAHDAQVWGPWTQGQGQVLELFTRVRPVDADAVKIGALLHFDTPIVAKSAGVCTLETMCAASDSQLGAGMAGAIENREKSVMRISFMENGAGFVCTATLLNTEKYPAPYVVTANHCIDSDAVARTIKALWFYESDFACPGQGLAPTSVQTSNGMQLVFTNFNVDSTLLLMNQPPPSGALFSGWNAARLATGDAIASVSHPQGDTARYAVGNISQEYRLDDWPQDFYGVRYSRGIIQGGSSGSGLFTTAADGSLELRGILTGTTVKNSADGLSCTDLAEDGLYSRFEIFAPEIVPYITRAGVAPDDAPNRPQDLFGSPINAKSADRLDQGASPVVLDDRHIDYAGDLDVYRIVLASPEWVSAWTEGANIDTVGTLLDSQGVKIGWNDDAEVSDNHFGISKKLDAGTYYLQVAHWDPAGTGAYNLRIRSDSLDANYTDLWWNANESGWGINIDQQDNTLFATLFTYDRDGSPMWLVMSGGTRQADGSFSGELFRTTGSPFDAAPFAGFNASSVGTMRIAFAGANAATLTYTYNGTTVTKSITRQPFAAAAPDCEWSAFDRSYSSNFQDLWWNPNESGWGVNVAHHGDTLFATLFTYDQGGKGLWLVLPQGERIGDGVYSGTLYRTSGPSFDASPWRPISNSAVGTMTFRFANGNAATLTYSVDGTTVTKSIQRQTFGVMRPDCGS